MTGRRERPRAAGGRAPWRSPALLVIGGWLLLVLISLAWDYVIATSRGMELTFGQALRNQAVVFVPWIPLLPLVLWLAHRYPFTAGWKRAVAAHGAGLVLTLMAHALMGAELLRRLQPDEVSGLVLGEILAGVLSTWLYLSAFTYAAAVAGVHAYDYYRRFRTRERRASRLEARLVEAQLAALRGRLRPHFLFNALQAASALLDDDPGGAEKMLRQLGGLLRASTDASRRQLVPLRTEMAFIRGYLDIQSTRFRDRLTARVEMGEEVADIPVPSFLLQPLVENALRHGLEPKSRRGELEVVARRTGERLQLLVRDDGGGQRPPPPERWVEGVGLSTTRERLDGLYGDEADLELSVREAGGVEARVELPVGGGAGTG